MSVNEQGLTVLFAAALLAVAGYFGWQQIRAIRGLTSPDVLGADDRRYILSQALRRLFCSVLIVVFAGMLIGWLILDANYRDAREEWRLAQLFEPPAPLTPEQKDYARLITVYWVAALFVLLVLFTLAAMDFWATARYGLSQHRKLQADQRAILEQQAAEKRPNRNGFRKP